LKPATERRARGRCPGALAAPVIVVGQAPRAVAAPILSRLPCVPCAPRMPPGLRLPASHRMVMEEHGAMDRLALASHELLAAALRSPGAAPTGLRRLVTGSAARGLCVLATGVALVASTPLALGAKRSTATRSAA